MAAKASALGVHAAGENDFISSPPPGGEICDARSTNKLWILFSGNSQLFVAFAEKCGILILYYCVVPCCNAF